MRFEVVNRMPHLAIVTPIFNDFAAFRTLCMEIDKVAGALAVRLSVIGVDDGSSELLTADARPDVPNLEGIEILRLICNLGHQRAIAVGLAEVARLHAYDAIIVMDCDGEDRPCDLVLLIDGHRMDSSAIIVAQRTKRSEGLRFRVLYVLYRRLFTLLTGRRIDFGNFLLIPRPMVTRLAHMPEIWNHLAASVLRSRVRVVGVPTKRGRRYAGDSSTNLVSLLAHGLSAIAVFSDIVFVRLLILASTVSALALTLGTGAVAVRIGTDLAIPGWASNVVGISAIILFQAVTLSVVASLTMLASRSSAVFIPALHAGEYVAERVTLAGICPPHHQISNISALS
jgi:hypothetical protein